MKIANIVEPKNVYPAEYSSYLYSPEGDENYRFYLFELQGDNDNNSFEFINWYLIPMNNGEEIQEINYKKNDIDTSVKPGAVSKYWVSNEELTSGGVPVERYVFQTFVNTAKKLDLPGFKVAFNNSSTEPMFYSFARTGLHSIDGSVEQAYQIIRGQDLAQIIDLKAESLRICYGNEDLAQRFYNDCVNDKCWYVVNDDENKVIWTSYNYQTDDFENYIMIPLKADGSEDLRVLVKPEK